MWIKKQALGIIFYIIRYMYMCYIIYLTSYIKYPEGYWSTAKEKKWETGFPYLLFPDEFLILLTTIFLYFK